MSLATRISQAVKAGDAATVRDLLVATPERERRSQREEILAHTSRQLPPRERVPERRRAAMLAWLATSTSRELGGVVGVSWAGVPVGEAVDVLADRPRKTRNAILNSIVRNEWQRRLWPIVFEFVRRGDFNRPAGPEYAMGAVGHVVSATWPGADGRERSAEERVEVVEQMCTTDPGLFDEVIAALAHEEVATYVSHWAAGILEPVLARCGVMSRDDTIDLCLEGFLRDYKPSATRFFQRVWAALDVSEDELVSRVDRLARIAATRNPGAQWIAVQGFLNIGNGAVDVGSAAAAAEGALAGTTKKLAMVGLNLLARVAALDPDRAVRAAATGLGHSRADVQEAALAFLCGHIESSVDPTAVRTLLLGWEGTVAPHLQSQLAELVGLDTTSGRPDHNLVELQKRLDALDESARAAVGLTSVDLASPRLPAPLDFRPWDAPVLSADRRIPAIETVDELVEASVAALAGALDGTDVERVLDGIARLGSERLSKAAASAVRAQYEGVVAGNFGPARTPLLLLMRSWIDRMAPPPLNFYDLRTGILGRRQTVVGSLRTPRQRPTDNFVSLGLSPYDGGEYPANAGGFALVRMWELAHLVAAHRSTLLLATPTHAGGWIDPMVLVQRLERLASTSTVPGRFDVCQALLRVAPRPALEIGRRLGAIGGDVARAAARALGAEVDVSDDGLRRAAATRRTLGSPEVTVRVPARTEWAQSYALRFPRASPGGPRRRDDPVGLLLNGLASPPDRIPWWSGVNALLAPEARQEMSLAVTTMPRFADLYGAAVATTVVFDLNANRSTDVDHVTLAALLDPDVPLGSGAHSGLAVALIAKNETLAAVGADLFIDATEDGRLDVECLASVVVKLVDGGAGGLNRIAPRMTTAAAVSLLHADAVRRFWQVVFRDLATAPRDAHAGLQSLLQAGTLCGRGIDDGAARDTIEAMAAGSSKRAKYAREVLALADRWVSHRPELDAIDGRLDRAERWQAAADRATR
ncbi:MAG: DUF6493 family protein [Acidimicrobiia bacterium]|nr:DUF6493 family protein [Acidimicrobiia bacterium]